MGLFISVAKPCVGKARFARHGNRTKKASCPRSAPCTWPALRVFSAMPAKPILARVSADSPQGFHKVIHAFCGRMPAAKNGGICDSYSSRGRNTSLSWHSAAAGWRIDTTWLVGFSRITDEVNMKGVCEPGFFRFDGSTRIRTS